MSLLPKHQEPPFFAVLSRTAPAGVDAGQFLDAGEMMVGLAAAEPGFLGIEQIIRDGEKYTVCYWDRANAVRQWRTSARDRVPVRVDTDDIVCIVGCLWPWLEDPFDAVTRTERDIVVAYDFAVRAA